MDEDSMGSESIEQAHPCVFQALWQLTSKVLEVAFCDGWGLQFSFGITVYG